MVATLDERLAKVNSELDKFEKQLGLPDVANLENALHKYLSATQEVVRSMDAEECGEAAYLLAQFSLHIQRATNREKAKLGWIEGQIRKLVTPQIDSFKGWSYEERRDKALLADAVGVRLLDYQIFLSSRHSTLAFLSQKVDGQKETYLRLQETKRKQR